MPGVVKKADSKFGSGAPAALEMQCSVPDIQKPHQGWPNLICFVAAGVEFGAATL